MPKRTAGVKNGLTEIIAKAVVDKEFGARLLADPNLHAKKYKLSPMDSAALHKITKENLEEAAQKLAMRADWWIGIGFHGTF